MPDVIAGLRTSTLLLTGLVLVLAALTHFLFRWWVNRKVRQEEAVAGGAPIQRRWFSRALRRISPPVLVMIWVQGVSFVLGLLLDQWSGRSFTPPARVALSWSHGLAIVAVLFWLFSRVGQLVETVMNSLARQLVTAWDDVMLPMIGRTVRQILPLVAFLVAAPILPLSPGMEEVAKKATTLLLIGVMGYLLYQAVEAAAELIVLRHRTDTSDNLQARAIQTQVMVLKKVVVSIIAVFAIASMLMVFESARQFGANILASAGIAGIVVGLAAQRSIATLLAGFQIALTQPIRMDDVVIVENEWGRIEEITLTYVVVRIWDLRRLIVPITYFIEKPFQNWTRTSADLLATVFLHADYTVPLDELRAELTRLLHASKRWDGKVNVLQVTDSKERTLEIRALASAANGPLAWDLRCEVREGLVTFLQKNYPDSLPRLRAEMGAVVSSTPSTAGSRAPFFAPDGNAQAASS